MKNTTMNRRRFLQSSLMAGFTAGTGGLLLPSSAALAQTGAVSLQRNMLINLFLSGGPDHRHLVVPQYIAPPPNPDDLSTLDPDPVRGFAQIYWHHRQRSHDLNNAGQTAEERWNQDYYHITVGGIDVDSGFNWNTAGLVDVGGLNANAGGERVRFGIWKEAGWLIDMFRAGNVALVFNAVGGTNRAHDLSTLQMNQGNLLSGLNNQDRSGWGGRIARSVGGNAISVTSSPSSFCFGPQGNAPGYDPDAIDNKDLISVNNSREIGLFEDDLSGYEYNDFDDKMARSAESYYAALQQESVSQAYTKFLDHEQKVRQFGQQVAARLIGPDDDNPVLPIPTLINALRNTEAGINIDPNDPGNNGRRVLFRTSLGDQIRNIYDIIAVNDLLNPAVISMSYGGWDTHGQQRRLPAFANDLNRPNDNRGIESNYRDIFQGQFGLNPSDGNALHCGFSALWDSLSNADRNKLVITVAGEFGRQIRDNGDRGTDHGKGNLMMVISNNVRGGIYGEVFPAAEIQKYDDGGTPDITPLTELDHLFGTVANWVSQDWLGTTASDQVFPRTSVSYADESPIIEMPGMFNNLFI